MPTPARKFSHGGQPMTETTFAEAQIAERHRYWLREQAYTGQHKRKRLANDFGVSEGMARLWLEGGMPASRHLVKMIARWGRAYVGFVWQDCGDWARAMLVEDQLDRTAAKLDSLRQQIEELRRP